MNRLSVLRAASALLFMVTIALGIFTLCAMNASRRWMSDVNNAVTALGLSERKLQIDLLNSRAGLLRNRRPVAEDLADTRASLIELDRLPMTPEARRQLAGLHRLLARQENLVKRFNSDNALLQSLLGRFTGSGAPRSAHEDRLSARILQLALDTRAQTARAASEALEAAPEPAAGTPSARLRSDARSLILLLPAIDDLLREMDLLRVDENLAVLRSRLREESRARAATVRRLQFCVAVLVILQIAAFLALVFAQRSRTRELQNRAANEQLSAAIATPLIDTAGASFASRVDDAVRRLALHIGAKRLQLIVPGNAGPSHHSWPGTSLDPDWLRSLVAAADLDDAWVGCEVIVPRSGAKPHPALDEAMARWELTELALIRIADPACVMLGFEPENRSAALRRDHVVGVGSALVAIAHGARREAMQAERDRLERSLARAHRMEAIGAMASGVAHNFNNIIGAIGGFAELGQERSEKGSAARYAFDEIQDAASRARDLVDDILRLARRGRSSKRPISLTGLLAETVRLLGATVRDGGTFRMAPTDSSFCVGGTTSDLQQVFLNILGNAAQAGAGRPVMIGIRDIQIRSEHPMSHGILEPGDYVVVSVSDSGPGIPATAFPRLFEPFFTTRADGTGLGLSTAWEIVLDHGGTIDVENLPDGGACFSTWLPRYSAPSDAPLLGEGARILLLAEAGELPRGEEVLAELGYEPLGYPLSIDKALLRDLVADCDAVLISARQAPGIEAMLAEIGPALGDRPLLVATTRDQSFDTSVPYFKLAYPLDTDALEAQLSGGRPAPSLVSVDGQQ